MSELLVNVNVNEYTSTYTIDRILNTGFGSQQVIIKDKSKTSVVKALVEGESIPIDIFFFNPSVDKNNIYAEFNSQPEIIRLKKTLFSYLDKSNIKKAKLPANPDNIGMAIFPMYVWMQSDILRSYDDQILSLFNPSKIDEIQQVLSHIKVKSSSPTRLSPTRKSRSKSRSRSRSPPKSRTMKRRK